MRTAIKLILLNLLIAQIIAPILVMIPCVIYLVATTGNLDKDTLITMLMIPAQLAGQLMMGIYLWKAGYISTKKITWSPVSSSYLFFSALAVLTCGFVVSALAELMKWIPNIMEQSFDILQSGWGGILAIAVIGPYSKNCYFAEPSPKHCYSSTARQRRFCFQPFFSVFSILILPRYFRHS